MPSIHTIGPVRSDLTRPSQDKTQSARRGNLVFALTPMMNDGSPLIAREAIQ